jgi:hypothetical protein
MIGRNNPYQNIKHRERNAKTSTLKAIAFLILVSLISIQFFVPGTAASNSYDTSNKGIPNNQASSPTTGGALDRTAACVTNAAYNNQRSESWLAIDPTNPSHLVGLSKFFFDPEFYLFHLGSYVSNDAGKSWTNGLIKGFDCQSAPTNSWTDTTDPIVAFDSEGTLFSLILPFSFTYNTQGIQVNNVVPNDAIFMVKSTDGGNTWTIGNQGQALATYTSSGLGETADKQWMTVDRSSSSPFKDNIYAAWTVFKGLSSDIVFSSSSDHGEHFSAPVTLSSASNDGPFNSFAFLGTGPDGTLYIAYTSFPSSSSQAQVFILKSTDGGQTFAAPKLAVSFQDFLPAQLPNTTFRDGISDNFAVNPANGHLLLALEVSGPSGIDVQLTESTDGGKSWSTPIFVNDPSTVNDGTDQFQPTVAASPSGTVAVAFYDRRLACPTGDSNILPADAGRANFCINTSIQFYSDGASGLQALGSNVRVTQATWDPQNPGTNSDGLPHPGGPTSGTTFIGDYFGLALTDSTAYALFVSTYNLGQNPFNDQQQFVGIVSVPTH